MMSPLDTWQNPKLLQKCHQSKSRILGLSGRSWSTTRIHIRDIITTPSVEGKRNIYLRSRTDSLWADLLTLTLFILFCQYLAKAQSGASVNNQMHQKNSFQSTGEFGWLHKNPVRKMDFLKVIHRIITLWSLHHPQWPSNSHYDSIP